MAGAVTEFVEVIGSAVGSLTNIETFDNVVLVNETQRFMSLPHLDSIHDSQHARWHSRATVVV